MVSIPEEVRCAVCRSIFCCLDCRNRHEQNAHSPNDVWTERNRLQCGLCQGSPVMEFRNRNDFALIMHLCQAHLPLHCKKCLTRFNSIGDFSAANKCAHLNDVCSLQSPVQACQHVQCENSSTSSPKDVSDINYITAVQKSSFEHSISDSVLSLRNYSTILHTSNHPLYKTQSPCREGVMEKALVRQTSTPMHHNLAAVGLQSSCSADLVTSTSCPNNSGSSDIDTSNSTAAKPTDIRRNLEQQHMLMPKAKSADAVAITFKRSRKSPVTPLTRQVMAKSIHRAILEYQQHAQGFGPLSPKSPLDLRVRTALYRTRNDSPKNGTCSIKAKQSLDQSLEIGSNASLSTTTTTTTRVTTTIMNAPDSRALNTLETVYEQEKDANPETHERIEQLDSMRYTSVVSDEEDDNSEPAACGPSAKTPISWSRTKYIETPSGAENCDNEIWYTPKEYFQANVIENIEIFTPKVSKKRVSARRVDDIQPTLDTSSNAEQKDVSTGGKIWSLVSSFLRFASPKSSRKNSSMQEIKTNDQEPHVVIRRCASFSGVLREKNALESSDDEEDEIDPLQPMKRRRITSIDSNSVDRMAMAYRDRIKCRPPIRRMLSNQLT